jgi:hypothetical protein
VAELEFVLGNNGDCLLHLNRAEKIIAVAMGSESKHIQRIAEIREMFKP